MYYFYANVLRIFLPFLNLVLQGWDSGLGSPMEKIVSKIPEGLIGWTMNNILWDPYLKS